MLWLPWLAGALWVAWALSAKSDKSAFFNLPLAAGLGCFIGLLAIPPLLLLADRWKLDSPASFIIGVLTALVFAALFLIWRSGKLRFPPIPDTFGNKILAALLIALILAHLAFSALDLSLRPVFPWDAWTTWVYRAKVWFLTGSLAPFVGTEDWLSSGAAAYQLNAYHYPTAPSLIYLWPSIYLGHWDDSAVLLPSWLAGFSTALALFGLARKADGTVLAGLLLALAFLSLPIVGAHMALGGYADMFMAGFAGLGLACLLLWARKADAALLLIGLILLLASVFIKREGWVWLSVGGLFVLVQILSWRLLTGLSLMLLAAAILGWIGGDIPGVGRVGLIEGVLYLPGMAGWHLQAWDSAGAITANLLERASWHLLGWLWVPALIASLFRQGLFRTTGSMLLLIGAVLLTIFMFSAEAAWAKDGTAVNRVMLQVAPVLILGFWLIARDFIPSHFPVNQRQWVWAALSGFVLTLGLLLISAAWQLPKNSGEGARSIAPAHMRLMLGSGNLQPDGMLVDGFQSGQAVVSIHEHLPKAEQYAFLSYFLEAKFTDEAAVQFFWRKSGSEQIESWPLEPSPLGMLDLRSLTAWSGDISEFGFLLPGSSEQSYLIGKLSLESPTIANQLAAWLSRWLQFEVWQQHSVNRVDLGHAEGLPGLNDWVAIWLLLSVLALLALRGNGWCWLLIVAWLLLDARWLFNLSRQAEASVHAFAGKSWDERYRTGLDGEYYAWAERLKQMLGQNPAVLYILKDDSDYFRKRMSYLLAPHRVFNIDALPRSEYRQIGGNVLVMTGTNGLVFDPASKTLRWPGGTLPVELVDSDALGVLFRIRR